MGNQNQHRDKAAKIQSFVDSVDEKQYPEWVTIGLFYRALHLVEMMFAHKGAHTTGHAERNTLLKREFPEILRQYKPLYNFSLMCRYRFMDVKASELEDSKNRIAELERLILLEIREGPKTIHSGKNA